MILRVGLLLTLLCVSLAIATATIIGARPSVSSAHRGQSALKLNVIYNVLEIVNKLLSAMGQDVLDSLVWAVTPKERPQSTLREAGRVGIFFVLGVIYVLLHAAVAFFMMVTLNVAINSSSNALLTLIVSAQFVELKSAIWKKHSPESLFALSAADAVERMELLVFCVLITVQNLAFDSHWLATTSYSVVVILATEVAVDAVKHAFVCKFNRIDPEWYRRFVSVLCKDLVDARRSDALLDQSFILSRRIGFSGLALACLVFRFSWSWWLAHPVRPVHLVLLWLCIFVGKTLVSIQLLGFALARLASHEDRRRRDDSASRPRTASDAGGTSGVEEEFAKGLSRWNFHNKSKAKPAARRL